FQRLIRCDDPAALSLALRRALPMIENGCNVAALADDLLHWGEDRRIRWCFDYYRAQPPAKDGAGDGAAMEDEE
ncbi:MAG: type I-E CRISPR-associated protein Cse2/CasB, partial [Rhodobacteraceae bacterium]|nr:type I-E CRISPR-associated protein Cse2/CasB [Paracoccaceae bacterium]